jgi:FkbH-like protein
MAELKCFELRDYFVFPMVGWGPKSDAVRRITQLFNVGEDTIGFIDDQPFEREEVRAGNPKVRVYTHDQATELLSREEFDVPVTDEARNRREFYQNQEVRQQFMEQSSGDYLTFLRQSQIRVNIARAMAAQIDRIHELVQRTNQMNFSGNRYSKSDLLATLASTDRECYLIDAEDIYGKYGYIGFAVVQPGEVPRVVDLAFSCRVQSKRVEHAVLSFLMSTYAARGASDFEIFYHATEKNQPIAQVFPDLECVELSRSGSDFVYRRSVAGDLPDTSVVTVTFDDATNGVGRSSVESRVPPKVGST